MTHYEQDRVLSRLQQRVLGEPAVRVCFLSGSYGRRRDDAYSDIDVALVFADDAARATAFAERREFVRSVMPYVPAKSFDADHVRPYFHVALYGNGSKVDYRYETMTDLQPSYWDRELRILKDDAGWAERFQAAAPRETPPRPVMSGAELTALDERFWIMFWDVFRLLSRGDRVKAFPIYLQLLTFSLPPLLDLLPPEHAAHQALVAAEYGAESAPTLDHMRRLLAAYQAARTAVIQRHHIPFDEDEGFERAIAQRAAL